MHKKILFLGSFEYPTSYAHPHHALLMAREFNALIPGDFLFVVLKAPKERADIPYREAAGRFGYIVRALRLRSVFFVAWLGYFMLLNPSYRGHGTRIFINDPNLVFAAAIWKKMFGYRIIAELHASVKNPIVKNALYTSADTLIFLTAGLKSQFFEDKKPHIPYLVLGNAVDTQRFAVTTPIRELRKALSLPLEALLICYIGRFRPGEVDKGVGFMLSALPLMGKEIHMVFVGGTTDEVAWARGLAKKYSISNQVHIIGRVENVHEWAAASNILAYVPSDSASDFQRFETSPMKLFEYMAARKPIIVSDTPAIRGVLDESCAVFIQPDSKESFVSAVARISGDKQLESSMVQCSYGKVEHNTWKARASKILQA